MERLMWKRRFDRPIRSGNALRGWLACCFLIFGVALARAVTFTAGLDRDTISLGESVGFSLTFDGAQPEGTPMIPPVAGLQFNYVGPSSQLSIVNGQTTSKITHNYTITPRQIGEFTIPAIGVRFGNEKLTTQPLRLKVLKPGAPPPEAVASGSQPAFLRLQLPKTNIYLGEVIAGNSSFMCAMVSERGSFNLPAPRRRG